MIFLKHLCHFDNSKYTWLKLSNKIFFTFSMTSLFIIFLDFFHFLINSSISHIKSHIQCFCCQNRTAGAAGCWCLLDIFLSHSTVLSTQKCLISILHFFHFESIYFDCYLFQNFRIRTLLPVRDVKKSVDFWNRYKTKQSNQSAVSLVLSIQKSIPVENSWSVTILSWIWRYFYFRWRKKLPYFCKDNA